MSSTEGSGPTISVVVPLYQKRHRIEACIASVQAQDVQPLEVLLIDDGSTDGGGEVARALDVAGVRYVRQENRGVSVARNRGIGLARGEYVAFLDADDTWHADHLGTLTALARAYPEATLLGTGWSEDGNAVRDPFGTPGEVAIDLAGFLKRAAAGWPPFWTSAVAFRRSCLAKADLFPAGSRIAEDQDAWLTLLRLGGGVRSDRVTAVYHHDGLNPTIRKPHPDDFESVIFGRWSAEAADKTPEYRAFVAAHRLYTIERHIGYTPNRRLVTYLRETRPPRGRMRAARAYLRIARDEVRRRRVRLWTRLTGSRAGPGSKHNNRTPSTGEVS